MKRLICITAVCLLVGQISYGQTKLGFKAGVNAAKIKINRAYHSNPETRFGYQLGVFAERPTGQKLSLRTELYYALKGYRYTDKYSGKMVTISHNYISLPLLAVYSVTAKLKVYSGPEISLLGPVTAKTENHPVRSKLHLIIQYKDFDFGLNAGIFYALSPRITTDLRYAYGFSSIMEVNITNAQGGYLYTLKQSSNRTLQLSLNYSLRK